jgi:excisionase family DNA binding protein
MSREANRLTYDVVDAGKKLGLGRNATYEAIARGEIPSIRIGKRILVPVAALERLLAGGKAA